MALAHDALDAATQLLARGAPVDAMAGGGDEPLLHSLCREAEGAPDGAPDGAPPAARLAKLALLLEHGASVEAMNGRGESALDVALFDGGAACVAALLRAGARSTMTTGGGGCVLHAAAEAERADVLDAALAALNQLGVDLNQQDALGRTPLHVAVARGAPERVLLVEVDTYLIERRERRVEHVGALGLGGGVQLSLIHI